MYKIANQAITGGLSVGARITLGLVSALFGLIMLASAAESEHPFGITAFGIFCLLIALACATAGRVRQFIGSLVGTLMFCLAVAYLWSEMTAGPLFSIRKSEPSVLNAFLFFAFFGVPGLAYAFKVRFGFRRKAP